MRSPGSVGSALQRLRWQAQLARERVARDASEHGIGYAALHLASLAADALIDARLLRSEAKRGVLGPALKAYGAHSTRRNSLVWSEHDWTQRGHEWSDYPGFERDVIEELLQPLVQPDSKVVEIGPGGGRWTSWLVDNCSYLWACDVAPGALEALRDRLGERENLHYVLTPGTTLLEVPDGAVDAIWSFDVFVHIAPVDIAGYLREFARVMRPGAQAILHHAGAGRPLVDGWRAPMTGKLMENLAVANGLEVGWQAPRCGRVSVEYYGDLLTQLRKPPAPLDRPRGSMAP